jgi:hypothetical protein
MIYRVYISTSAVMIQEIGKIIDVVVLFLKGTCTRSDSIKANKFSLSVYVPRDEQLAHTTVSTGVVPFTKRVLVSECCGEGCGSILIINVYALNRKRTNQAQI